MRIRGTEEIRLPRICTSSPLLRHVACLCSLVAFHSQLEDPSASTVLSSLKTPTQTPQTLTEKIVQRYCVGLRRLAIFQSSPYLKYLEIGPLVLARRRTWILTASLGRRSWRLWKLFTPERPDDGCRCFVRRGEAGGGRLYWPNMTEGRTKTISKKLH